MEWLVKNAPGFADLDIQERDAISEFLFLWSYFEATVLNSSANANSIAEAVNKWSNNGLLKDDLFGAQLKYFRDRYLEEGELNYRFKHLHLRNNDNPELIKDVLLGNVADPVLIASALLTIVYRYRNNLFHGIKWAYQLQGQLDNFRKANHVLQTAIELNCRC